VWLKNSDEFLESFEGETWIAGEAERASAKAQRKEEWMEVEAVITAKSTEFAG